MSKIRKSPGITKSLSKPVPLPGEDKVSYERHIKALQVLCIVIVLDPLEPHNYIGESKNKQEQA